MNWWAWRCWFRTHEYVYKEVEIDPKDAERSARLRDFFAEKFDGNRIGINWCRRCGANDGRGVVFPDSSGGTITGAEYVERRFQNSLEEIARKLDEEHGGEVRVHVPSLSDTPIPVRDAMRRLQELEAIRVRRKIGTCAGPKTR